MVIGYVIDEKGFWLGELLTSKFLTRKKRVLSLIQRGNIVHKNIRMPDLIIPNPKGTNRTKGLCQTPKQISQAKTVNFEIARTKIYFSANLIIFFKTNPINK